MIAADTEVVPHSAALFRNFTVLVPLNRAHDGAERHYFISIRRALDQYSPDTHAWWMDADAWMGGLSATEISRSELFATRVLQS